MARQPTQTTQPSSSRMDSRSTDAGAKNTLRPLSCELSTLSSADGSALWKSGLTQVLASVHGPTAPRLPQHELPHQAQISVLLKACSNSVNNANNSNTRELREWQNLLQQNCQAIIDTTQYPRTVIPIVVQILHTDGSVLAACWHAIVAALLDAGIAFRVNVGGNGLGALPVAITILLLPNENNDSDDSEISDGNNNNNNLYLDPHAEEESRGSVLVVFTAAAADGDNDDDYRILACHYYSSSSSGGGLNKKKHTTLPSLILQCTAVAAKASGAVSAFWRIAMEQKIQRQAQTLWE